MDYHDFAIEGFVNTWYRQVAMWAKCLEEHGSTKTLITLYGSVGNSHLGLSQFKDKVFSVISNYDLVHDAEADENLKWIKTLYYDIESELDPKREKLDVYLSRTSQPQPIAPTPIRKGGYLYVLKALIPDTHYKIGLSKEPVTRIESLGVKLPFPIEPLHIFPTNDMFTCERYLHGKFAGKRVNGEWFRLEQPDLDYLLALSKLDAEDCQ